MLDAILAKLGLIRIAEHEAVIEGLRDRVAHIDAVCRYMAEHNPTGFGNFRAYTVERDEEGNYTITEPRIRNGEGALVDGQEVWE